MSFKERSGEGFKPAKTDAFGFLVVISVHTQVFIFSFSLILQQTADKKQQLRDGAFRSCCLSPKEEGNQPTFSAPRLLSKAEFLPSARFLKGYLSNCHTSDQLQRLSIECPRQPKNVKTFSSSDSLAKVQEVASWLLEMNQELLSVGSKRRRTGGSLRGNPSSSQADEEQMNRVVEEEQQQQQLRQQEEEHTARNGEVVGVEPRPGDQSDSQQGQVEENNNRFISVDEDSSGNQEEQEEEEEHAGEQDEEDEEEEEMDQESDDFDQSDDSSREDEHTHSNSVTNSSSIVDLPIHQLSSPFYTKTTKMKRKLDHGSEVRSFSLGKKPCKVSEYTR
ncbi:Hypothetical predicted protein [Marmota monax]|uniref:F-box/WD repeat-containing protein 7 n=1 Tax=Marmota monax TaxID=9995 RepID=A0A5E4B038_MARMO|nr:Hypothetical predicted protein [Marmota monax]